jgi:Cd2+/Zn2+-exporting ATPase
MEKENKKKLGRIIASAALLAVAVGIEKTCTLPMWQLLLIYLVPYLLVGFDVLADAADSLAHGKALDEDFLMSIATIGALTIGFMPGAENQFPEAVFVMLFFQVGELFEDIAEGSSRKSISQLMDIRPDTANVERDGQLLTVSPEEVKVGETIVVKPGEKIPLDGIVIEGDSSIDTVALTGESVPRNIHIDDDIMSGCVNLSGVVKARVTKVFGESTASKVLNLVENASANKSKSENFITKFARIYTPIVVGLAVLVAVLPPLISGNFIENFGLWLYRALTFLVVSCPCAFVISVPLTFFGGIGGASRRGILVKGSNYLETLAHASTIAFDKTGTMTKGVFDVTAVHPDTVSETQLLHLAAHVERFSTHPIAISLKNAYPNEADSCTIEDVKEIAGQGISAKVNGQEVRVGNSKMMDSIGAEWHKCHKVGTIVHVAINGVYAGHIIVSDKIKDDAAEAIQRLKSVGMKRIVMLTGDKEEVAADVAKTVGIDEYHAELLPAGKVEQVERMLKEKESGTMVFVGDGINDAPVLGACRRGNSNGWLRL